MDIRLESNVNDILLGLSFVEYESEDGTEGNCLSIGFILFSINIYFN